MSRTSGLVSGKRRGWTTRTGAIAAWLALAGGALVGCGESASRPTSANTVSANTVFTGAAPASAATGSAAAKGAAPSGEVASAPAPAPATAPAPAPVKLAFVGDIALNYSIAKDLTALAEGKAPADMEKGFPFAGVAERLRGADLAIGNLECVLSMKGDVDTWHKPFRGPVSGIDVILSAGVDVVSVANNHSWDYGQDGFTDMLERLDAKKLGVIGRGYRQKLPHEPEKALVREVKGTRVGLLGFYLEEDAHITRDVEAASKEADVVVAFFHWGKEKQSDATPEQRRQARAAIDAGADLVVGTHAHVMQPTEMYRGRLVAYGLGNFVFMGMNHEERFRRGAILEVTLTGERLESFELVPTRVDDKGAPRLVVAESSYLPGKTKE